MSSKPPEERISFETDVKGKHAVISIIGDVDLHTMPKAKDIVNKMIARDIYNIVLNLEKMSYIDSSGLGFLISTLKRLKDKGGTLRLVNLNSYIRGIFNLINLGMIIEVFDSLEDAVKGL